MLLKKNDNKNKATEGSSGGNHIVKIAWNLGVMMLYLVLGASFQRFRSIKSKA